MNTFVEWLMSLIREAKWWVIVQPWERAVRTRRGMNAEIVEAGLHFKIPVIDEVIVVNNRLRIAVFPSQTITTNDGKTVTVAGVVGFRITDPLAALMAMRQPEMTCAAFAQASVASYIAARSLSEIAVADLQESARRDIEGRASGMKFDFVNVVDFAAVKTIRLLQEQWRPGTRTDDHL